MMINLEKHPLQVLRKILEAKKKETESQESQDQNRVQKGI
jgi:hypothetical protein